MRGLWTVRGTVGVPHDRVEIDVSNPTEVLTIYARGKFAESVLRVIRLQALVLMLEPDDVAKFMSDHAVD